jgi:hypothetical protein
LSQRPRRVQFPAPDVTMAPKEPQPRIEGMSLCGAMASALQAVDREGAYVTVTGVPRRTGVSSTARRRVAYSAIVCGQDVQRFQRTATLRRGRELVRGQWHGEESIDSDEPSLKHTNLIF